MTHIHYKFSSKLSYDTVVFDGPHTTLSDLKRQIMGREKLRAGDCDLQITNAQTKEEYTEDDSLIPKGSSVIVRRIPIIGGKSSSSNKTHNIGRSDVHLLHAFGASRAVDDQSSTKALSFFSRMQMANLVDADVSEEDKIKVMMNQSAYDSMNLNKKLGTSLPGNYTCYRCGTSGHHIRNCPMSGQDKNADAPPKIKKSTGIPRSFMVEVDDPSIKGAMLTNCGRYAIPAIDAAAYAMEKKEKPPFLPQEPQKSEIEEDPIPDELLCVICKDLLCDAVVIPCCGNSYCDDCIRTTLLDSEDHVCPTCSQSEVSPDTLIANKFLRQAVNNFKKERGYTNRYGSNVAASQSQGSNPTPNPAPPLPTRQSLLQKPLLSPYIQQQKDPALVHPKAAKTPPLTQVPVAPPTATCSATDNNAPSTSSQSVQIDQQMCDKEAENEAHGDSAAGSSSPLAPSKNPTAAPSQPIPLVNHNSDAAQLTVSVNQQLPSSSASNAPLSASLDSSSSSAAGPAEGQTGLNSQLLPPSSSSASFSVIPPPLFPPSVFHTIPPTHQANCSYPPGYLPPTPIWTPASLQGSPIPSLCSSTSSIYASKEWYGHQRRTKERSPHRGSSHRRSSSNSKSAKSKFSHSYSRSSSRSRSRSRSRSQGRSRAHSPHSHRRDLQSRSRPSSYSYGYKRSHSPTPSSSSSPRGRYQSTSKSPRNHHHSRHHHSKRSSLSSCSSRRRGESSRRDAGGSTENRNQSSSSLEPEIDRERYLQWKKEYTEWCEKYFSSYVGQFHQLPLPPFLTVPPFCPQWEDRERWRFYSHGSHSRHRAQDRRTSRRDDRSPSSESSSYSGSSPSHSSSDGHSTPSQSPSHSRSSLSHKANEGCSPHSQLSSEDRSTPSDDRAQTSAHSESCAENDSQIRVKQVKEREEERLEEPCGDEKQLRTENVKEFSPLKLEEKRIEEVIRGEGLSVPAVAEDDSLKKGNAELPACSSDTPAQKDFTAGDATESLPHHLKRDEVPGKHHESKAKEEKHSDRERSQRRSKYSHSGRVRDRHSKAKPRKQSNWVGTGREESPGKSSRASDSRSAKSSKRKREDLGRNERERSPAAKHPSSKHQTAKAAKTHESRSSESPKPFDKEKQKTEKNTRNRPEAAIWEGGIKVKPQKKISININLEKKREDENSNQLDPSNFESIAEKPEENTEGAGVKEEETLIEVQMVTEANEDTESKDPEIQQPTKPEAEEKTWDQTLPTDASGLMLDKATVEDETEEDLNLWHCAFGEVERVESCAVKEDEAAVRVSIGQSEGAMEAVAANSLKVREDSVAVQDSNESISQRTEDEIYYDDPMSTMDTSVNPAADICGAEESQERRDVETVEEYSQDRAADGQNQFPLLQVCPSKWERSDKEGQGGEETRVYTDTPAVAQPHPSVTVTSRETERDNDHQRQGSREMEREQDRVTVTGKDKEQGRNYYLSTSNRSVSPSSGKDETGSTSYRDPERDRQRDRARRPEEDKQERSHREKERSKEHRREKEKERNEEKKWDRSSDPSAKRGKHSSSHSSTSHDRQRSHRQRESSHRSASSVDEKPSSVRDKERRRSTEASDQNPPKAYRDASPARKSQDASRRSHHHSSRQDPSRTHRHQSTAASSHHSTPSRPQGKETEPLPFESSRKSPDWGWIHNKSRI